MIKQRPAHRRKQNAHSQVELRTIYLARYPNPTQLAAQITLNMSERHVYEYVCISLVVYHCQYLHHLAWLNGDKAIHLADFRIDLLSPSVL